MQRRLPVHCFCMKHVIDRLVGVFMMLVSCFLNELLQDIGSFLTGSNMKRCPAVLLKQAVHADRKKMKHEMHWNETKKYH